MASSILLSILTVFFSLCPFISSDQDGTLFKPNTLVLPVLKDSATGLHVTKIHKRTPLLSIPLIVDLNGRFLWVNCEQNYLSPTYHAPFCHSTQCSHAGTHYCHKCSSAPARPGCHNNTCGVMTGNPVTHRNAMSELAQDVISIQSATKALSNHPRPGPMVTIPHFLFACAPSALLRGPLPRNVQGVAGLSHAQIALPTQLASYFGYRPQFSLCLPSSNTGNGVISFGSWPYNTVLAGNTPLTIGAQGEYYIRVRAIRINDQYVPFNISLFSGTKQGHNGTTAAIISTTTPYTVLEHSIFVAFNRTFATQLANRAPRVNPVPPFELCYNSKKLGRVPKIDFVLQNRNVTWRIFGGNAMVQPQPGVSCLGFVDGGLKPRASIVIGSYQLEDNLLQFDLANSTLSFSSSLLFHRTNCAGFFNLTPAP